MFQFPEFAPIARFSDFIGEGCPIRKSTNQILFADPRSLSQLITSFFASESLGIPHTLLFTSFIRYLRTYLLCSRLVYTSLHNTKLLLLLLFHQHVNELLCQPYSRGNDRSDGSIILNRSGD
jgi:hypothetical protein